MVIASATIEANIVLEHCLISFFSFPSISFLPSLLALRWYNWLIRGTNPVDNSDDKGFLSELLRLLLHKAILK